MLRLLRLLQDGRFHSGEELGASMGISRSAIWKRLQALEEAFGLRVHKVQGRGYRLEQPLFLLDAKRLSHPLPLPCPVDILETVDSTNAQALRHLQAGRQTPFLILSECQTAGRGRRGRVWASPFGENLYYSLAIRVDGGMRELEGLSLVVGLALLKALREMGLAGGGLKWPNDLLVGGRKLAGILIEIHGDPADACHVVIGVGVNVNMQVDQAASIDQPWTSMRAELGNGVDRNALVLALSRQLFLYLELHREQGFAVLLGEWQENHLWQGRQVKLTAGERHIEGVVLGVDGSGGIRLSVDGAERVFSGGELSLRLGDDS